VGHNQGVFDINGGEMLVLAGVALVVLGPDKLPGYAAQAARLLRQLRTMADGAKEQMRDQLGPEFDDIDWKTLDPRQYDPRRIVRDALMSDEEAAERAAEKPVSTGGPTPVADEADQPPATPGERSSAYDDEAT
jgi:sec-independent protein translocase protein TatB